MEKKWRKRTAKVLAFALLLTLIPAGTAEAAGEPYIKIGLKYGSTAVTKCTLSSDSGFLLGSASNSGFDEYSDLSDHTELDVFAENGQIVLSDDDETVLSDDDCLMPVDYEDDGMIVINGTKYRGGVMFQADGNKLTIINFLLTERYVRGVLSKEMPASWNEEALKAQAVAARSFAEANRNKHRSQGFHLCATTHCQSYGGVAFEHERTDRAIAETDGEVLWYEGRIIAGNYFSDSNGYTRNCEDVWGGYEGYLRGVEDLYSPASPWTANLSYEEIEKKLAALGSSYSCGSIESIAITGRDDFGYVNEMTFTGSDGTTVLKGEKCRTVFNLRSADFILAGDRPGTTAPTASVSRLFVANRNDRTAYNGNSIFVLSSHSMQEQAVEELYVTNGKTVSKVPMEAVFGGSTEKAYKSVEPVEGHAIFSGLGFGHSVGMSQQGAQKMASLGFTYDEILKYYYTDIEVR